MPSAAPSTELRSWKIIDAGKWGFSDLYCKNLHLKKLIGFKQTFPLRTARKIR